MRSTLFPRERNGALLRVHAVVCAKVLDTADIVRDAISRQERALCISDCSNEDKRITSRLKALRRGHECVR
jgi:hypothetical protein